MTPCPTMLRLMLRYDPETGRLFWRERPVWMFKESLKYPRDAVCRNWNAAHAGQPADTSVSHGYRTVSVFKRKIRAHRAIWAMETGAWPSGVIDHQDWDRAHNRLNNLRDTTQSGNLKNTALRSDNTSGVPGVYPAKGRWRAQIRKDGKTRHVGIFDRLEDAIAARKKAEDGLGYHPNHGRLRRTS